MPPPSVWRFSCKPALDRLVTEIDIDKREDTKRGGSRRPW
jgi:hypothetical protein